MERRAFAGPGIVDEDCDRPVRGDGGFEGFADRIGIRDVGGFDMDLYAAFARNMAGTLIEQRPVAADQGKVRAEPAQAIGNGRPDPARRAGDKRMLAGERAALKSALWRGVARRIRVCVHYLYD